MTFLALDLDFFDEKSDSFRSPGSLLSLIAVPQIQEVTESKVI